MSSTKLCDNCGLPITHSNRKDVKYCNRKECRNSRALKSANQHMEENGLFQFHCFNCGRTVKLPKDTPKEKQLCKRCAKKNIELCSCCGTRPKATDYGLHFLCWECYITDGNYDAEAQRRDSLDWRFIGR